MKNLNAQNFNKIQRKAKILQFGEGNFLRAFVDWIIFKSNQAGVLDAGVVVVQPVPQGRVKELEAQDGLFTLCLEGIDNGKIVETREIVDVFSDFVNPNTDYQKYLEFAKCPDIEVVVSNTTEAGIVLDKSDTDFSICPKSFPGKLLAFLERRFEFFNGDKTKGLAIVPCELIDDNGTELKKILVDLAKIRGMSEEFLAWLSDANHFTDTLVDRIVPGYPRDSAEKIQQQTGYIDNNIVKAEVFHLWVLKKESFVEKRFPVDKAGLNVIYADSIKPYKQRKVKILNGTHTAIVPVAYLCGLDTVGQSMKDANVRKFAEDLINLEIKPTIELPREQMDAFAKSVLERFENPFIYHELMSIALNSTTKFKTRLLPSYNGFVEKFNSVPKHILFAFAAMCVFFKGKRGEQSINLQDNPEYLEFWKNLWQNNDYKKIAEIALSAESIWEQNLATQQNVALVSQYILQIDTNAKLALQNFLGHGDGGNDLK